MALPPLEALLVTVVLCAVLSALAYAKSVLTWDGSVAAFAVGLVIGVLGDVTWLLLLLFFLLSSVLATRVAPVAVAVLSYFSILLPRELSGLVFISVLAVAGADTLASEIGVLSPNAYLISIGQKVAPGTDGGIS